MERMRAAKNNPKEGSHDVHKPGEFKRKKQTRKGKGSEKSPKTVPEITGKETPAEINNKIAGSEVLRENASKQSATQFDSLKVQGSPELAEISEDRGAEATDQKQRERLEWFSTWDQD